MAAVFLVLGLLAAGSGTGTALWLLTRPLPPRGCVGLVLGWTAAGVGLVVGALVLWGG